MTHDLEFIANTLLEMSKKAGADSAEAIILEQESLSVDTLNGSLESLERSEGIDVGLRVILNNRQACISSSDIREVTMQKMVERSLAMAREAPQDDDVLLAARHKIAKNWDLNSLDLIDEKIMVEPDCIKDWAIEAEAEAKTVKGVTQVQSSSASVGMVNSYLATSNGFSAGYSRSSANVSCVSISGKGLEMERDYAYEGRVYASDLPAPAAIGLLSGQRAVERVGSKKAPTGNYPVIYDERISSTLIGHFLNAINGSSIVRGSSWLRGSMDAEIFPKDISIIENPLKARCFSSRPFDSEGLKTYSKTIVSDGILKTWLLDLSCGKKLNLDSTANAVRSISAPPTPGITNITFTNGSKSKLDLMNDMGTGLIITAMIGLTINPITGDYSRGVSGFWLENGEIQYPVNECTVAGNLKDIFKSIIPANDARNHLSFSVPSLLVEGLKIAGK